MFYGSQPNTDDTHMKRVHPSHLYRYKLRLNRLRILIPDHGVGEERLELTQSSK